MRCIIFTLLLPVFLSLQTFAQKSLKGKVFDAGSNAPLFGATITISGKSATTTDKDGVFFFDCSRSTEITVTYIGYEPHKTIIKNCNDELKIGLVHSSNSLNEIEITATSNLNKSILYQPASITKLSTVELKRGTGLFLDDAINSNVPGVTMQRRSISGGQQLNIRGYGNGVRGTNGLNSNFDMQGAKVYLNNIPITDAEGITVLDDIDFNSIGNIEVTKGPAGTIYGLAIAGVVNLNTIKPEKGKRSIGQDVLAGSYGLQRYTTHLQIGGERSSLLVNYGHQKSDGFVNHTASRKDFINVAADFQPNDKQTVSTYFGYSNSYDQRAGESTLDQYQKLDYSGNPNYIKNNAHSEVISFRAGISHTYAFTNSVSNTTTVFGSGVTNTASSAGGWTDKTPVNYGIRSTLNTRFALNKRFSISGITGIETQRQNAQTIGYAMVADSTNLAGYNRIGATRSNQYTISKTTSLFTEWTLAFPHEFSVTAGIGMSNMNLELNDRFFVATSRLPSKYATSYTGMFSPHLALNKVFSKQFSVYASYSKGYKAPVSSYFYIPTTGAINRGLKPEIGNQYEVGTKGALMNDKLTYQVALFDAIFSDKMMAVAVPLSGSTTTTAYTYIANGGKQDDKGVEVLLKFTALHSDNGVFTTISPFANFTYSDFKYDNYSFQALNATRSAAVVTDYNGKAVAGVSPVTANVGVDFVLNYGFYANIMYMYKDKMPITSDGLYKTTSYSLLNAKAGIRLAVAKHFDFDAYFGANNIAGTQYSYMVFVNQLPDAYIPAPNKVNYFGGINLQYNF